MTNFEFGEVVPCTGFSRHHRHAGMELDFRLSDEYKIADEEVGEHNSISELPAYFSTTSPAAIGLASWIESL